MADTGGGRVAGYVTMEVVVEEERWLTTKVGKLQGYVTMEVVVEGVGGHSSVPPVTVPSVRSPPLLPQSYHPGNLGTKGN